MVLETIKARPAGETTRRLISTMLVDVVDPGHAEASCYITVCAHTGDKKPDDPAPIELLLQIGNCRIKQNRTPQGAHINEIAAKMAFRQ